MYSIVTFFVLYVFFVFDLNFLFLCCFPIKCRTSVIHNVLFNTNTCLRAVVSNFRESGDRSENSIFFLFAPKDPFGELFSKIIFKSSSEFLFWQELGKFEIGQNATDGPIEIMQITTFLKLSFKTR